MTSGILFFVVGPSGSGKDTLIDGARSHESARTFVFARRTITRPAGSPGEDHDAIDEAGFAAREASGGFLISWAAHGLRYGIPVEINEILAGGRHVVANGSRSVITDLRRRVPRLVVLEVWAPDAVLADRLRGRGREGEEAIRRRVGRSVRDYPEGIAVVRVANDGTPEDGIARFVAALAAAASKA